MADSEKIKKDQVWIQYVVVVLFFFLVLVAVSIYSFNSFSTLAKEEAVRTGLHSVEKDAEIFNNVLNEGKTRLQVVWRIADHMMQDGDSLSDLKKFFEEENLRYRNELDTSFTGVYGYVNNTFVDGNNWPAPEEYDATTRPWFQKAIQANDDDVQLTSFYSLSDHGYVISASHILRDRKSVVALNISLSAVKRSFAKTKNRENHWIILDRQGTVIDHHDSSEIGMNYLSDVFWGTESEKMARQVIRAGTGFKEVIHDGRESYAFIASLQNEWLMVNIVSKSVVTQKIRWLVARNVIIGLLLVICMGTVFTMGLVKHRRISRVKQDREFVLKKMSHEMHATINGILGMNSVVLKSVRDDDTKGFVENVNAAVEDLASLISDVQEISDLDGEDSKPEKEVYDVFGLVSDCYKNVLTKASLKNLQISLECDSDLPSSLWGDVKRIRHTINNILADAVKRTEAGGILMTVGFDHMESNNDSSEEHIVLKISIRDTGEGLSVGRGAVDDWSMASAELCLANLLLKSCGGELVVKSRYGESTTFMVSIPQIVVNIEPMGDFFTRFQEDSFTESKTVETLFAPSARILVVDDVDMNLKVVRGLLKDTKIQIDTAVNSTQCLEMVAAKHYDLILLDYSLPVVDGIRTFDRMQKLENSPNRETPVVMATAKTIEFSDSYLRLGLTDFISKPFMEQDLMRMLAWYLPKHRILTRDDLQEITPKTATKKRKKLDPVAVVTDELEFHSVLTPAEKLKVFDGILDVKAGLEYFSHDARCYTEILQEFVREDRQAAFRRAFLTKDWNNYLILVHSVNGVASAIGAHVLAMKSQEIEKVCKESKYDEVIGLHDGFILAYIECLDYIKKGLSEYDV